MVSAWYMDDDEKADQRLPHKTDPLESVDLGHLASLGVHYWHIPVSKLDADLSCPQLADIRRERGYSYHDVINVSKDKLPNYEVKIKSFFEEHLHTDEEIRYILDGSGYFDVRDQSNGDRWIRIALDAGDMIVLPAGIYHRFTLDEKNYIKAMRLFQGEPVWTPHNRDKKETDALPARADYLKSHAARTGAKRKEASGVNGTPFVLNYSAQSLANYPHMRAVNGMLYVSGISSRRADNTHWGAEKDEETGEWRLDVAKQTRGVIENLRKILATAEADLSHVVDLTCFLVNMDDYQEFNNVYNEYFDALSGPTRTTVAVKQLPHPNLLIEIKAVAVQPSHDTDEHAAKRQRTN
eukprot:TRINITY_DN47293_c0_g1_i1.p1 TRINITY_DN47293_c0_g1~~TRINITY_DN47293_c0_g1_i1.p1  ORF type:complete len:352 (-),score=194.38 TRINITY_DN47293_c0_g1_i1:85-1140(-)